MVREITRYICLPLMVVMATARPVESETTGNCSFLWTSLPCATHCLTAPRPDHNDVSARCLVGQEIDAFHAPAFPADLVSLRLYNCVIHDFDSICELKNLRELHVLDCGLRDITPLGDLAKLSHLSLAYNDIMDIDALSSCRALTWLDLRHNRIMSISALRMLDKLASLDIRGNLFDDGSKEDDIHAIRQRNPTARVLLGPDASALQGDPLRRLLSVKASIANFALNAEWHYHDGYPNLPLVSDEMREGFLFLREAGDQEYMADVTIVLMRYAVNILTTTHTGTLLGRKNPIVAEFLNTAPRRELAGDEITTGAIARWVSSHRDRIPPSAILDAYIERYRQVETALADEWKALEREGGASP